MHLVPVHMGVCCRVHHHQVPCRWYAKGTVQKEPCNIGVFHFKCHQFFSFNVAHIQKRGIMAVFNNAAQIVHKQSSEKILSEPVLFFKY